MVACYRRRCDIPYTVRIHLILPEDGGLTRIRIRWDLFTSSAPLDMYSNRQTRRCCYRLPAYLQHYSLPALANYRLFVYRADIAAGNTSPHTRSSAIGGHLSSVCPVLLRAVVLAPYATSSMPNNLAGQDKDASAPHSPASLAVPYFPSASLRDSVPACFHLSLASLLYTIPPPVSHPTLLRSMLHTITDRTLVTFCNSMTKLLRPEPPGSITTCLAVFRIYGCIYAAGNAYLNRTLVPPCCSILRIDMPDFYRIQPRTDYSGDWLPKQPVPNSGDVYFFIRTGRANNVVQPLARTSYLSAGLRC